MEISQLGVRLEEMGCGETVEGGTFDDDSGVNLLNAAYFGVGSKKTSVGVAEVLGLWTSVAMGE